MYSAYFQKSRIPLEIKCAYAGKVWVSYSLTDLLGRIGMYVTKRAFFSPSTCEHCPHDLCIFCCCQQLISSNQNVHLPCHVPCAFSLCSSAVCLFCNTVLLAFLFLILSVALSPFKIENPAFLLRFCKCIKCSMLQLYWLGECISNVLEGVYVQQ